MTWRRALLVVLAPAVPFLAVALAAAVNWLPDNWYAFYGDVVALALVGAGLVSGHVAFLVWRDGVCRRRVQRAAAATQSAADLARGDFLYRLEHEMQKPLAAARGELENLRVAALTPPERQALEAAATLVQRAGDLAADLCYLADLRTQPLGHEPVELAQLAQEVVSFVHGERATHPFIAGGGQVAFECQVPWQLPAVVGDRELLLLALYNLVGNACKFTPSAGRVRVLVGQEDAWLTVAVIDTGRGIPPEDLARVGHELHRAPNALDVPGHGLGLAMARVIAERHRGTLDVQSRVGQGTMVTMRLPAGKRGTRR